MPQYLCLDLHLKFMFFLSIFQFFSRPHGDPQMIRFGAHLVLVLRYLLADEIKDAFKEKLMTVGDRILQM